VGGIEYASALFERNSVERYLGYWLNLLKNLVSDDQQAIAKLALLSAAERQTVLYDWNATQVDYPKQRCVHELFEAQVAKTPNAIAAVYQEQQLSYSELNSRANQLAHHLRALGVLPDVLVGICVERGFDLIIGLLGILKAGGAYVPLDPNYPRERLEFMLQDSAPLVLLCETTTQSVLHGLAPDISRINLSSEAAAWAQLSNANLERHEIGLTSEHLAYIIYTSGSTGKPKGVMIPHRAIGRLALNNAYVKIRCTDRVAFVSNPAFDAATFELWTTLLNGAQIIVIEQTALLNAERFKEILRHYHCDILFLTVELFNQYADLLAIDFSRLRYMLVGGDRVDPQRMGRVLQHLPPQHLLNCYGPTETTTFACTYEVNATSDAAYGIPIGRPIANTQIYILDNQAQPVPIGVAGELYIAGEGVARGYLNRPELTAERFLPNPFCATSAAQMYKTGDLVRWLPDGNIEFIGRNDYQVKIRGFRIELGEIENALSQCPGVSTAVVIVREEGSSKQLIAYYSATEILGADVLRIYLKASLPDYMIPAAYVYMEAFTLTPNGKLDRKSLPDPQDNAYAVSADEAPIGETERVLAAIWSKLLKIARVGRSDNFFELGGHSLLAIILVSNIKKEFKIDIPLASVFNSPTIKQMAELLNSQESLTSLYSLFTIHQGISMPPLFWMEYHHNEVVKNISNRLYGLYYGIGAPLGNSMSFPPSIELLATHYIEQLLLVQPQGPYFLIGHSWGGLIAYEMAQQLTALNHEVGIVFMCDTFCPGRLVKSVSFAKQMANIFRFTPSELINTFKVYFKALWNKAALNFRKSDNYRPDKFDKQLAAHLINQYTPKSYAGRVILFKAMDVEKSIRYQIEPIDVRWKTLIGEKLEVHEIPDNHMNLIQGQAAVQVGNIIAQAINSVPKSADILVDFVE
jgi:amino acid adenylation domain-containing protein